MAFSALASGVQALPFYSVQVTNGADLGTITSAAAGDTVFRIDPATGAVTIVSGGGVRASSSTARATITISCKAAQTGDCTQNVNVKLGPIGTPLGRARALANIQVSMGTAILVTPPTNASTPLFTIGPIGPNSSKTFFAGADFGIAGDDTGLPTGNVESDFYISASEAPNPQVSGGVARFTAKVIRGIAIAKTSDLSFGAVARPAAGSGTVVIDPATGARQLTGGIVGMTSPTPSRAAFNITGEGGQAFSITAPATFDLTGPQTITVTTSNSAAAAPILSGALGVQGTYSFGVGGTAPVTSTTPTGTYTGSFTVTVAYN